jgi:hypothetical protein
MNAKITPNGAREDAQDDRRDLGMGGKEALGMNGISITLNLRPTSEMMLLGDALIQALNRLAAAMEYQGWDGAEGAFVAPELKAATAKAPEAQPQPRQSALTGTNTPVAERPSVSGITTEDRMFTKEREDIIAREWPLGTPAPKILEMLHALPGRQIEARRLGIHAAGKLGVKRPAPIVRKDTLTPTSGRLDIIRQVAASLQSGPTQAAVERPPILRAPMPDKISMNAEQLFRWASQRGVSLQLPIDERAVERVNAKALAIGHPPIEFVRFGQDRTTQ